MAAILCASCGAVKPNLLEVTHSLFTLLLTVKFPLFCTFVTPCADALCVSTNIPRRADAIWTASVSV